MAWNESFSVNVAQLDSEHKRNLGLLEEFSEAISREEGRDVLSKMLRDLLYYTLLHFKNEEQLMLQYGYPGYESHKSQHFDFVNKSLELNESYEQDNTVPSASVLNFINTWVAYHIKEVDMLYVEFFKEKGLK
jgi:hemerythrin